MTILQWSKSPSNLGIDGFDNPPLFSSYPMLFFWLSYVFYGSHMFLSLTLVGVLQHSISQALPDVNNWRILATELIR